MGVDSFIFRRLYVLNFPLRLYITQIFNDSFIYLIHVLSIKDGGVRTKRKRSCFIINFLRFFLGILRSLLFLDYFRAGWSRLLGPTWTLAAPVGFWTWLDPLEHLAFLYPHATRHHALVLLPFSDQLEEQLVLLHDGGGGVAQNLEVEMLRTDFY